VNPGASFINKSSVSGLIESVMVGPLFHKKFTVKKDGFLEVLPEMFIPQARAVYRQSTLLDIEEGGNLLVFESIAPGRVASGEVFQYTSLEWKTDLFVNGRHLVRERYNIQPGSPSLTSLQQRFPTAYYGSLIAVHSKFTPESKHWESLRNLQSPSWIGQSPLDAPGAWSINGSPMMPPPYAQPKTASANYYT